MKRFLVVAAVVISMAEPAVAGGRCVKPYAPVIPPGAAPAKEDMARMREDVQAFVQASDLYQQCLMRNGMGVTTTNLVAANQVEKERVARAFNALVKTSRS
jgi:hypothetical protein